MVYEAQVVAFAGDWHGNIEYAVTAIDYAHANGADTIVHVGDFGLWPSMISYLLILNKHLQSKKMQLYFVDGNHEHFPYLYSHEADNTGFRSIMSAIHHIPRGHVWEWQNVTFMGLGGAYSIDRMYRKLDTSWFVEETLTEHDTKNALRHVGSDIDFMVTHDAPDFAPVPLDPTFPMSHNARYESNEHRKLLGSVVRPLRPRHLIHGHYHVWYQETVQDIECIGLNCDGAPLQQNIVFVDLRKYLENL